MTENADGLVTSVRLYSDNGAAAPFDGVITGTGMDKSKNDIVTLNGNGAYTWADDVVVAQYDDKSNSGAFESSKMSSIKNDTNDEYLAVLDEKVIVGLLVRYMADDEKAPDGGTTNNKVAFDPKDGSVINYTVGKGQKVPSMATIRNDVVNYLDMTFDAKTDSFEKQKDGIYKLVIDGLTYTVKVNNDANQDYTITLSKGITDKYTVDGDTKAKGGAKVSFTLTQNTAAALEKGKEFTVVGGPADAKAVVTTAGAVATTKDVYTSVKDMTAEKFAAADKTKLYLLVGSDYVAQTEQSSYNENATYYTKETKTIEAVKGVITITFTMPEENVSITGLPNKA